MLFEGAFINLTAMALVNNLDISERIKLKHEKSRVIWSYAKQKRGQSKSQLAEVTFSSINS